MSLDEVKRQIQAETNRVLDGLPENTTPELAALRVSVHLQRLSSQWKAEADTKRIGLPDDNPVQQAAKRGFES